MKKSILTLVLVVFLTPIAMAHNLDRLIKKVERAENVEKVKVSGFLLSLGKILGATSDLQSLSKIEVYNLSNCHASIKKELSLEIEKFSSDKDYETLLQVKEKKEHIKILLKRKKNTIKELLILVADSQEPSIIRLHGNIKQKDLNALIAAYDK